MENATNTIKLTDAELNDLLNFLVDCAENEEYEDAGNTQERAQKLCDDIRAQLSPNSPWAK